MGSRSGTGYRNVVGYRDGRTINKYTRYTSKYLEKNKPRDAVNQMIELITRSLLVSNQLYATYVAYLVSKLAYETFEKRKKQELVERIQELGEESMPFIIGSLASDLVDDAVADFMRNEQSPMNQNQIALTKTAAKETLVFLIQKEIERVISWIMG